MFNLVLKNFHDDSRDGKRTGMLGGLRKNITNHAADSLYNSFIVHSVSLITATVYGPAVIKCLQRCAARIVVRTDSSEAALQDLK